MQILLVFFGVVALGAGQVEVRLPFGNPAGVTLTGAGFANNFAFQGQPQNQPQPGPQPIRGPQPQLQQFAAQEQPQPIAQEQPQQLPLGPEQQQAYAANPAIPEAFAANPGPPQAYAAGPAPPPAYAAGPAPPPAYAAGPAPPLAYAAGPAPPPAYAAGPALPVQPQFAYAPAPVPVPQYHRAVQYAPAAPLPLAPVVHQHQQYQYPYYAAPPVAAYHQQVGFAATPVLTKVPGVADVPVTKLAYSQGFTQQEVDVHQPAVSTRRVKVRRPALRKEFYDIEHRVIVRPAGSATLELSQPIAKEQQGPAVLTPTKYAHIAPVVRYGAGRRIVDGGPEGSNFGGAFGLRNSPPPPQPPQQPQQAPAAPQNAPPAPGQFAPQQQRPAPQLRQAVDEDTEVVEAEGQGPPQQGRDDIPNDVQPIQQGQQPGPPPQQPPPPPAQAPQQPPPPPPQQGLTITPDMPLALQNRLLELLTAKGGTVTEILNKDGSPADSASVLQVADALGDPSLQGGERITTRRIVVTRPIETIQEIEVQEPATKVHRKLVQQPALFKHHVPAVARVPVAIPAVKHVATPVVKTTYTAAHPSAYSFNYQAPQFSYSH